MRRLIFLFLIPITVEAQTNYSDLIDQFMQAQTTVNQFSGNVIVVDKDKTIYKKSFGKADRVEIASGKIIEEQNVSSKQNLFKFNTSLLANGVYLISVKGENISPSFIKVINIK